jgi:hypothetical protein
MQNSESLEKEYLELMSLFFMVVDCRRGQKIDQSNRWLYEAEVLGAKLFNHIVTALHLWHGTDINLPQDKPRIFVDHSSISVIVRAAFETYLTFYFIYCDSNSSIEERKLRYLIWRLRGFLDRQNFKVIRKESLPKIEQEKEIVFELLSEIESNLIYKDLPGQSKKLARKGEWRLNNTWAALADIAGFNPDVFRDVYSYLCSYSHSGGLSALQIGQAINVSDQQDLSRISLHYGLILMSHFVQSYNSIFPETGKILESNPELKGLASKWHITWKETEFLKPFSHNLGVQGTAQNTRRP